MQIEYIEKVPLVDRLGLFDPGAVEEALHQQLFGPIRVQVHEPGKVIQEPLAVIYAMSALDKSDVEPVRQSVQQSYYTAPLLVSSHQDIASLLEGLDFTSIDPSADSVADALAKESGRVFAAAYFGKRIPVLNLDAPLSLDMITRSLHKGYRIVDAYNNKQGTRHMLAMKEGSADPMCASGGLIELEKTRKAAYKDCRNCQVAYEALNGEFPMTVWNNPHLSLAVARAGHLGAIVNPDLWEEGRMTMLRPPLDWSQTRAYRVFPPYEQMEKIWDDNLPASLASG